MSKNYFESLCSTIFENGRIKKFKCDKDDKNSAVVFKDNCKYVIEYDEAKKQIILVLTDSGMQNRKILSSWLFDDEFVSQKDINLISKDFIDTITGKEKNIVNKSFKKKSSSSDESNVTGLFFANRMVNIFPELKEEIQNEKMLYCEFRSAVFSKEYILPKVQKLLSLGEDKAKISKLGKLLSELYQNGTLDARSIITIGILNNIEGEKSVDRLRSVLSEELQKSWDAALKYKGKKIKPEKLKNKKSLLSKALEMQQTQ